MIFYSLIPLVITPVILHVVAHKFYITPNDHPVINDGNTYSFPHVLSNSAQYFTSHTQLFFFPGSFSLERGFIVQNVNP